MILITGGTGFLGGYIIKSLIERGLPVRAIRRSAKKPFFIADHILQRVEWIEGDVLDIVSLDDAMKGCTGVIHAAAIVSFSSRERQHMYDVNIEGTKNVVNLAIENGIERFVHVSSVAALGRTQKEEMVTEDRQWIEHANDTHYAITKKRGELEVWRGLAEGLSGVIVNPSTILGFGEWHSSSCALFKNAYKEFPWYTEGINGFVGVEDTAEAIARLYLSHHTEQRFIINSENWTFRQVFTAMAKGFEKKEPYRKATPFLGELAWRLEGLKHLFSDGKPLLTKESARVAHSKTQFSNDAILNGLPGFTFTPIQQVIAAACTQYKEALANGKIKA